MIKIKIFSIGKTKESWLIEAIQEYEKRLRSVLNFEWVLFKTEKQLYESAFQEKNLIALTPDAKMPDSIEFADLLFEWIEMHHGRLSFLIGGPTGIPSDRLKGSATLSLSRLTFTHQMVRLLLVEQTYRAFEIKKNSRYHRGN